MKNNHTQLRSNILKINSCCRNRRRENPINMHISEQQQRVNEQIAIKTVEFQRKVQLLQMNIKEIKEHVKRTRNGLNSLHHYFD